MQMIYYVEDDTNIRELTLYALQHAGFEVQGFANARDFRVACTCMIPDLVLLDVMLPETDGITLLKEIRQNNNMRRIPVMMLSAKDTEYDKVMGLDSGADDYLSKPFGMVELVSRCKALLRRCADVDNASASENNPDVFTCGCITLSKASHEITCNDVQVDLTLKEFDLLAKLMSEPARAFSRAQLLEDVWDISFAGGTRTVDTHVQTLRRKLNVACEGAGDMIQTVRGVGYCIKNSLGTKRRA